MMFLILVILTTIAAQANSVKDEYLIVRTSEGYVRGLKSASRNGKKYTGFKGIQYGRVASRFQEAEGVQSWKDVKDALEYGSDCPQINLRNGKTSTDENCLFLNIYVPDTLNNKKPVIFYIHGGAWMHGSSQNVGEKYFMDEDIILVTMNYRVGAFGFLALNNNTRASGNIGFMDQLLALKWVRNNVGRFGGDPDRITIMGESAGAGSVANFLVSPLTGGLFHSAIHHSGAILNPWAWRPIEDAAEKAFVLGKKVGCDSTDGDELLDCLVEKDVVDILSAQKSMPKFYIDPMVAFMPVLDPKNPTGFLPNNPVDIIQEGKFHRVPTIFTMCLDEGLLLHAAGIIQSEEHIQALNEDWVTNAGIQALIDEDGKLPKLSTEQKEKMMTRVREYYFGRQKLLANEDWTMRLLSEFYTDRHFMHGIQETALKMSEYTPVYAGIFTNVGADSVTRIFGYNKTLGVSHVDDLQFFFNDFGFGPFPLSPKLTEYSEELIKIWTNFAKNGVPTGTVSNNEFEWPKISEEERDSKNLNWLDLGYVPNIILSPFPGRVKIWDEFYKLVEETKDVRDEL